MLISKKKYEQAIEDARESGRNQVLQQQYLDNRLADISGRVEGVYRYIDKRLAELNERERISENETIRN